MYPSAHLRFSSQLVEAPKLGERFLYHTLLPRGYPFNHKVSTSSNLDEVEHDQKAQVLVHDSTG